MKILDNIKKGFKNATQTYAMGYRITEERSMKTMIKGFNFYRKISGFILLFATLFFFLFQGDYTKGFFLLGVTHVHAFLNQYWWKLSNIENNLEKKKEDIILDYLKKQNETKAS